MMKIREGGAQARGNWKRPGLPVTRSTFMLAELDPSNLGTKAQSVLLSLATYYTRYNEHLIQLGSRLCRGTEKL